MDKLKLYAISSILLAIVLAVASLFIPTPDYIERLLFQIPFFFVVFSTSLYICSIFLFIHGLSNFKVGLKVSYIYICIGVSIWGLAFLQLPLAYYFNFWSSPWITYGFLHLPGMMGTILIIVGGKKFAGILGIKTKFGSFVYLLLSAIVVVGITTPLPRIRVEGFYPNDLAFHLSYAFGMVSMVLGVFVLMLFLRIKQSAGQSFTKPLAWFFLTLLFHIVAGMLGIILAYVPVENAYFISSIYFLPWIVSGLALLTSSYYFNKIGIL